MPFSFTDGGFRRHGLCFAFPFSGGDLVLDIFLSMVANLWDSREVRKWMDGGGVKNGGLRQCIFSLLAFVHHLFHARVFEACLESEHGHCLERRMNPSPQTGAHSLTEK